MQGLCVTNCIVFASLLEHLPQLVKEESSAQQQLLDALGADVLVDLLWRYIRSHPATISMILLILKLCEEEKDDNVFAVLVKALMKSNSSLQCVH